MYLVIKGAGDLASGVALRLHNAGFKIVMTDLLKPTAIRRTVSFCRAIREGEAAVEGVFSRLAQSPEQARAIAESGAIAVMADPEARCVKTLRPPVLIDAVLAKRNIGTRIGDAPIVIALGPGFTAGTDCHAVVETMRGHHLGRVYYAGGAIANTGIPGEIAGYREERILRAPDDGLFLTSLDIGAYVRKGQIVATVNERPVVSKLDGVLRGLLPDGTPVHAGMKSGDVDPRGEVSYCETVSDKARAIGGGVLEAILHLSPAHGFFAI